MKSLFLYAVTLLLVSCAAPSAVKTEHFYWPPPPDKPRIEWLHAYSSQLDIEKSTLQRFWAAISGDDSPRSLIKPIEVKSIPELNKILVSDIGLSAVVVFDLAGHAMRNLVVPEDAPQLRLPLSIALDKDGGIYVLERRSSCVLVFDSSEKYQRSISLKALSVTSPVAMVIDKMNSQIYVSDATTSKIVVMDLQGGYIRSMGGPGVNDGQFNLPVAMALDSKHNLIVADAFGASVQIFDHVGRFLSKFGQRGDRAGNFQLIKSIAVDSSDNIYVVDGRAHNISVFNENGELLLVLGGYYASIETGKIAPGGFSIPVSIDIDATDKIYVVDQMNRRVQVFQYFSEDYLSSNKSP